MNKVRLPAKLVSFSLEYNFSFYLILIFVFGLFPFILTKYCEVDERGVKYWCEFDVLEKVQNIYPFISFVYVVHQV